MYHLRYSEQAKKDLVQIRRYLTKESGSKEVARRFLAKLRQQCQQVATLPGMMGRARPELFEGLRSLPYGNVVRRINFPYLDTNFSLYSSIF